MGIRQNRWRVGWIAVALAVALVACGRQEERQAVPTVEEKTFSLTPATAPVKASFLTGELHDLKVTKRVEQGSGTVVDPPKLRGTLKLKNASRDQAARLIAGKIEYMDAGGKPIPVDEGRADTTFKFSTYQTERLDPGMETSHRAAGRARAPRLVSRPAGLKPSREAL